MDTRENLVRYYRWLRQYGYNDSHSGNASVREGEAFWITPTGACADTLASADLVRCGLDGRMGLGASTDARLHLRVYERNPAAQALLHSHGPYTVALTMSGDDFTPVDFEGQYYFERVPVITIPYASYFDQAPEAVAEVLSRQSIAVVRGHGVYACAESLDLAYKWTCSLEQCAKTAFIARLAGTIND